MKYGGFLFVIVFVGISFVSVSTVEAQTGWDIRNKPSGPPPANKGLSAQQQLEAREQDSVHPGVSGAVKPGDIFQPRPGETAIEPIDILRPGGAEIPRRWELLR